MALKKIDTAALETKAEEVKAEATPTPEPEVIEHASDEQQAAEESSLNAEAAHVDTAEPEQVNTAADAVVETQQTNTAAEPTVETQQVALKPDNTAVTTVSEQKKSAMQSFTADAAAQGFEGLTLTGMSFDRLKLNDKHFQLGIDETNVGIKLLFALLATRNVYIIRQFDGKGAELFYSYDKEGRTNTDGTSAQETLDKWAEDGYGGDPASGNAPLSVKEYIEATVQLKNRDDEHDEAVVMMSIPPASKQKLGGAVAVGQMKFSKQLGRQPGIGEMLYEASVGPKVGSGEEAFNPWVFKAVGLLDA